MHRRTLRDVDSKLVNWARFTRANRSQFGLYLPLVNIFGSSVVPCLLSPLSALRELGI